MSSSSDPYTTGPSNGNVASFERRLSILLAAIPVVSQPPVESIPRPGSSEEADLFRTMCLEMCSQPEDVRRSVLTRRPHPRSAVIALSTLRCPFRITVLQATWFLGTLSARMGVLFRDWCLSWYDEELFGAFEDALIEDLRRVALEHLTPVTTPDDVWKEILIRVCGDLPELWRLDMAFMNPTNVPSGTWEDEDSMALDTPDAGSVQAPQTIPQETISSPSFDATRVEVNSAGSSATYVHTLDQSQHFPDQSSPALVAYRGHPIPSRSSSYSSLANAIQDPSSNSVPPSSLANTAQAVYRDDASSHSAPYSSHSAPYSSHSAPSSSLTDPVVYQGDSSASHSLPNLPSGAVDQDIGRFGGRWSGHDSVSLSDRGRISGSSSMTSPNFQSGPHPSNPMIAIQREPCCSSCRSPIRSLPNNSVASNAPFSPVATTPMVTSIANVQQAHESTPRRSVGSASAESLSSEIRDAIALEKMTATALTNRANLLRMRTTSLNDFGPVILSNMRYHYYGLYILLNSKYLNIPLPDEFANALRMGADDPGKSFALMLTEWDQDVQAQLRVCCCSRV